MQCTTSHSRTANKMAKRPCCLRRERLLCSATSTWSAASLLLVCSLMSAAEAAGLWGLGSGSAAQRGFDGQSVTSDDGNMDEFFAKLQQEQVCS